LDHNPQFEALSYAWGAVGSEKDIIVNNVTIPVRRNLWDALFHLQKSEARHLWIDAVCIDQANTAERNHQVQQMSAIDIRIGSYRCEPFGTGSMFICMVDHE
jgi:hypothetical protein